MDIRQFYRDLGVEPVINACGPITALSGALIEPEVAEAMAEAAAGEAVRMDQLQGAAGRVIAEMTGAESAYVTAGASAAMTLATAACLAGLDPNLMDRLPDTNGMRNEVIIARDQRNCYDHAIRAAGAKLVEVGINDIEYFGTRRATEASDFEAAIGEKTAAIAFFYRPATASLCPYVVNVAKKYNIPIILDAAAELPPVENLRKFVTMGADLVAISGGKAIRGPKSSGILCGRRDLIASAALQNLDLTLDTLDTFNPPSSLIRKEDLKSLPHNGIGRGLQVGREEIVGLLTALKLFTREKCIEKTFRAESLLKRIVSHLDGISNVRLRIEPGSTEEALPSLQVWLDEAATGHTATDIYLALRNGRPSIYTGHELLSKGALVINPFDLDEQRADIVAHQLREALISLSL